jgi:hypothetical protein
MQIDALPRYRRLSRQHPFFSPVALISTLLLGVSLAVGVYYTGGRAFSPGELSAVNHSGLTLSGVMSHAELGNECGECHEPFVGVTAARCELCHEQIGADRVQEQNLHGRLPDAADCAACHLEHRGAGYDLKTAALSAFDHAFTSFSLQMHEVDFQGTPLDCSACHFQEAVFDQDNDGCRSCHEEEAPDFMEAHQRAYGMDCAACHDGEDTLAQMTAVEHQDFFTLQGAHLEATCAACHTGGQFDDLPESCAGCHGEPAVHASLFTDSCDTCHSTAAWLPAAYKDVPFDHAVTTSFSLTRHQKGFVGEKMVCTSCHQPDQPLDLGEEQCLSCHQNNAAEFMRTHTQTYGRACRQCHDGTGRMAGFTHDQVWPLAGEHSVLECAACHEDYQFVKTPSECAACHEEPEIHQGIFGFSCHYCHTSEAWLPARLRAHTFPLDHGAEAAQECETCHQSANYVEHTCIQCHEHPLQEMEPAHADVDMNNVPLSQCITCHLHGTIDR